MILSLMICETNLILYEKENEMVKDVKVCGHPVYLDKLILVCMTWWHLFLICLHTIISCPKLHNIKPIGIFHLFWLIHLKLFEKYIFSISLFGQVKGCVMYLLNHRNQRKKISPPQDGEKPHFTATWGLIKKYVVSRFGYNLALNVWYRINFIVDKNNLNLNSTFLH